MAVPRAKRRHIWWTLIHRAMVVALTLAFLTAPEAAHHPDNHGHADQAPVTANETGSAKAPSDSGAADKCNAASSCTVLAIAQADFVWVALAQEREVFRTEPPAWHGVVLSPVARPPIS